MKKVIAKFRVTEKRKDDFANHITLVPVISGSAENESFYKATPGGAITLGTVNDEAAAAFEENKEYYVTFEEAGEESADSDAAGPAANPQ